MALKKSEILFEEVQGRTLAYRKSDRKQVCGAKAKSSKGGFCSQTKLADNGRCRIHGAGAGRPATVGLWTRSFGRLKDNYLEARADPELLDLERGIAVLSLLASRAIERLEERDTPEWRKELLSLAKESRGDGDGAGEALAKLYELIEEGSTSEEAEARLRGQVDRMNQRLEKLWAVKLAQKNAVSATDLVAVLGQFLDFVRLEAGEEAATGVERRMMREMDRKPKPSRVGIN